MKRAPLGCALWLLCVNLVACCDLRPLPENEWQAPSFDAGAELLPRPNVSEPAECKKLCCENLLCRMALVAYSGDVPVQCRLVRCLVGGRNVCELEPSSRFRLVGWKKPLMAVALVGKSEEASQKKKSGGQDPLAAASKNRSTNRCLQPMKVGPCRAAFPKFYYDAANQTCRSFLYGGCEANGNNFDRREDCEATCSGVTGSVLPEESSAATREASAKSVRMPLVADLSALSYNDDVEREAISAKEYSERCEAEPTAGPCRAALRHWYYDSQQRECKTFLYGGCRGNKNNYVSQQNCLDVCDVSGVPAPKKLSPSDLPSEEECLSSPDPGFCRAAFPKFYYDPAADSCQSFIYGGCGGNKNRYDSAEECQTRCSGAADGSFAGRDKTRSRWTAAFFVLMTLAAVCTVLVSALVVTMLRRLRVTRRASVVSDKEGLLPEVRSSLESLTFPISPSTGKA